jgi:hypothetical protein
MSEKHYRAPWMTDAQWIAADAIAECLGGHNHMKTPKAFGKGIRIVLFESTAATFDDDLLTRLVLIAHEKAIRIEIESAGRMLAVNAFMRGTRTGAMHERHPTIDQACLKFYGSKAQTQAMEE